MEIYSVVEETGDEAEGALLAVARGTQRGVK